MIFNQIPKLKNEISSKLNVPLTTEEYEDVNTKFEDEVANTRHTATLDMNEAYDCKLQPDYDFTKKEVIIEKL